MTEMMGVEDPGFGLAEDAATVERLMAVLGDREREVLRLRFAEDLTQSEIGLRVGVSQMHVSRLIRQAVSRRTRGGRGGRGHRGLTRTGPVRVRSPHGALGPAEPGIEPRQPRILHSKRGEPRSIAIYLPAGEALQEHEVHERVPDRRRRRDRGAQRWKRDHGRCRVRRRLRPARTPEVRAMRDARLLLVLAPLAGRRPPGHATNRGGKACDGRDPVQGDHQAYPDGFEAVKAIDLDIGDGEFMILVGPSATGSRPPCG